MKVTVTTKKEIEIKDLKDLEKIENKSFLSFEKERVIYKNSIGTFVYADSGEVISEIELKRIIKSELKK